MRLLLDTHIFLWYITGDSQFLIHRDPFDRMLICQAMEHDLTIVTVDAAICVYTNNVLR